MLIMIDYSFIRYFYSFLFRYKFESIDKVSSNLNSLLESSLVETSETVVLIKLSFAVEENSRNARDTVLSS